MVRAANDQSLPAWQVSELAGPEKGIAREPFRGFEHYTANFVYCPNQFFDVCLPICSRGTLRLVAFLLHKTLGWLDENGEPIEQDIAVSYGEMVAKAGISRGAIRKAIDEAIAGGFIECVRSGRRNAKRQTAETAQYRLRWDSRAEYVKDASRFDGFYAGEGNRTPIPNAFFDHVVIREPLAVLKVVGAVLRHTVGYANQFGTGRRTHAALSYSYLQDYANVRHRPTLAQAIRVAVARGYIVCVEEGYFDPAGKANRPAAYAVRWLREAASTGSGSKTEPVTLERFKNRTGDSSESEPVEQFKNRTDEKTSPKDTDKQQDKAVAADFSVSFRLLRDAGFDEAAAQKLARHHSAEVVKNQIDWLDARNPCENRLGMLRLAIDEGWSMPPTVARRQKRQAKREQADQEELEQAAEHAAVAERKRNRRQRADALLQQWRGLSSEEQKRHHQTAIEEATSDFLRRKLRQHANLDEPPIETLEAMARIASLR